MNADFVERWYEMLNACLAQREARLFSRRYRLEEGRIDALQTIAVKEGISRERVRQILNRCFRKLAAKANRNIEAGHYDSEEAALVYHLRSIVVPDEEGHVDRLVSYLVDEFGHFPPSRTSLTLLMRLVYRNRQEVEKYRVEAQRLLHDELRGTRRSRSSEHGKFQEKPGAKRGKDRRAEIIQWLASSRFAEPHESNAGFHVRAGHSVRLQNGQRYELLDWLKQEGILTGMSIGGYRIAYRTADEPDKACILFSRVASVEFTGLETDAQWELPSPNRVALNRDKNLPLRAYAAWNEAEEHELTQLFSEGLSQRQLAQHFLRQRSAIHAKLKKLGLL